MTTSNYSSIGAFGGNMKSPISNPWNFCINETISQSFNGGPTTSNLYAQYSKRCQIFTADYCAQNWDENCEKASKNINYQYPNIFGRSGLGSEFECEQKLTAGDYLIRNAAAQRFKISMGNCNQVCEPFDPNVADSPIICYDATWGGNCMGYNAGAYNGGNCEGSNGRCIPQFEVNPKNIDRDIIMNKVLANPKIAISILINIYNTMKRKGTFKYLAQTQLGRFFNTEYFQRFLALVLKK